MNCLEPSIERERFEDAVRLATQHKLYGRGRAVAQLLEALARISRGDGEVLFVPGVSGAGKTVLAQVLRAPTRSLNGHFLEGKFNQYGQNPPYFVWRQALAEFYELVSQEDTTQRKKWTTKILDAVEGNGQLLLELVPEFETLLGKQPPVAAIAPQEARHRFAGVIRALLGVICRPEHPLVLFVDDCQWADADSLRLLTQLQIGSTLRYLLIIAAYRSNEMDEAHPWTATQAELRNQAITISESKIRNLEIGDVQSLVADALVDGGETTSDLAQSIHAKSQGNPFFAHTLLDMFRETANTSDQGTTASSKEERTSLPDSVVDVFTNRINRLKPACRELLSLAACLGNRFELDMLEMISGRSGEECEALLLPAASDLVKPIASSGSNDLAAKDSRLGFRFIHDEVQQAAFVRIPAHEMQAIRLDIARKMLGRFDAKRLSDQVCEVAEHFNAGLSMVEQPSERLRGVELNLAAARKAVAATAFRAALQYHRAARRCLDTPPAVKLSGSEHRRLVRELYREQAETEFLEGDSAEAERCIRLAVAQSQTAVQKAESLVILVMQRTLRSRYADAIAIGREALAELGITLPEDNYEAERDAEIAATRRHLQGRSVSELHDMPPATDESVRVAARVLVAMGPPCYRAHQSLWSVIVARLVNLTLRHGYLPQIGYSHPAFAGLLGWVSNDYDTARQFSELATHVMASSQVPPSDESVFHLLIGNSVRHWFKHLIHSTEDYTTAYQIGQRSGNPQYAAYALAHNMYCRYYQGIPLQILIGESQSSLAFSRTRHNRWATDLLEGGLHVFGGLQRPETSGGCDAEWESDYVRRLESQHNQQIVCIYKILRTGQYLVMGQLERALELSDEAEALIHTVGTQGLLPWAEHVFARLLSITGLYTDTGDEQQALWRTELERLISQLRIWAKHCPENFGHKYLLSEGEMARLDDQDAKAIELYDQAIDAAHDGHFWQWEGLANERAASFWRVRGNGGFEQLYWQRAYQCFDRWGAMAKLEAMEADYRQRLLASLHLGSSGDPRQYERETSGYRRLLDRHVELLRKQTRDVAQARDHAMDATKTEELANVADSLRANVSERRRTAAKLRRQRDLQREVNEELERRVEERTAELSRAEARFRTVLESAPIAMVIINHQGEIVLVNTRTEDIFGYARDELLGKLVDVLVPEALRAGHADRWKSFFENPTARPMGAGRDLNGVRKDGTEIPVEIGLNPVDTEDGPLVLAAISDVTERRRFIERLKQSNIELEQFAYVASHDLQEPLRKISAYAELLKEEFGERISQDGQVYLRTVIGGAQRLKQLVSDLLVFSRIATDDKTLQKTDANDCLKAALDSLELAIEETGARITSDQLPVVTAESSQLTMLFQNLVSNAIKYHSEGPPSVHIGAGELEHEYEFFVQDKGIGIEPRFFDRIFEIFKRLHGRQEYGGGTGIGLANCKRIVDRFGGKIWVESTPGEGSTFYFTIKKASA